MTAERFELKVGVARMTLLRAGTDSPMTLTMPAQGARGIRGYQGEQGVGLIGNPGPQGERGVAGQPTIRVVAASGQQASHTGDASETILATVTIQKGHMGPNGRLRIVSLWSATNNANAKTARIRFGGISGTIFQEDAMASSAALKRTLEIDNRGAVDSQLGKPKDLTGFGTSTGTLVTSSVDTDANDVDLVFTGQLGNGADSIALEAYIIELMLAPEEAEAGLYYAGDGVIITDSYEIKVDRTTVPPVTDAILYGNPQAPTPTPYDDTERIATCGFVQGLIADMANHYLTIDPTGARLALGLGTLALLNVITWAEVDATLNATVANYRAGADQHFLTAKTAFDAHAYVTLADASTITPDFGAGFNFTTTITTNRMLGFPVNLKVGQNGFIEVVQPAIGGKVLDFASGYTFDQGNKPIIDTPANSATALYYHVRSLSEVRIGIAFKGARASP